VTVADTAHGALLGDFVTYTGASTVDSLDFNQRVLKSKVLLIPQLTLLLLQMVLQLPEQLLAVEEQSQLIIKLILDPTLSEFGMVGEQELGVEVLGEVLVQLRIQQFQLDNGPLIILEKT